MRSPIGLTNNGIERTTTMTCSGEIGGLILMRGLSQVRLSRARVVRWMDWCVRIDDWLLSKSVGPARQASVLLYRASEGPMNYEARIGYGGATQISNSTWATA